MGHGLILTNCRGLLAGKRGLGAGARGADFTLEKSGNGAGKEELRSRRRLSFRQCKEAGQRMRKTGREKERERRRCEGAERGGDGRPKAR